jgi:ankyrin repeat protein
MSTKPIWYEFRNAVYAKDYELAERLLSATPQLLTLCSGIGETALHYLAVENDIDGVAWLHSKGATIDTKNEFGTPVIFEVAQLDYKELLAWFVKNGADLHAVDKYGEGLAAHLLEYEQIEMREHVRQYGI